MRRLEKIINFRTSIMASLKFDEEILASLHNDLNVCRNYIRQVSQGMVKGNVSKYPIFVVMRSETDIDLGLPIINKEEMDLTWAVNASHLEDFVNNKIIIEGKVAEFMKNYKDPNEFMCVFVAEEGMMSFIFMPYEKPQIKLDVSKDQLN
jgi:hypothetical protein